MEDCNKFYSSISKIVAAHKDLADCFIRIYYVIAGASHISGDNVSRIIHKL